MLAEAAEADADEDERLGEARGDELPAELVDARSRRERLRRCRESLEQEQADEEAGYQANLAWRARSEAEHGRRLAGRKPTPPDPAALERKINTTDHDTRLMKHPAARRCRATTPGRRQPRAGDPLPADQEGQRARRLLLRSHGIDVGGGAALRPDDAELLALRG
jgi:hypothetical protein